ncbi:MAG: hypothetical protein NTZ86_06155 [Legionellales bacterium]|nr:hypothetical protein [Legionellales bacterium]
MKNITLGTLSLITALTATAMSSAIYADSPDKTSSCTTCGCGPHKNTEENLVTRESVSTEDSKGTVAEQ